MFSALSSLYHAIYKAEVDMPLPSILKTLKKGTKNWCMQSAHYDTEDELDLSCAVDEDFITNTSWAPLTFERNVTVKPRNKCFMQLFFVACEISLMVDLTKTGEQNERILSDPIVSVHTCLLRSQT